MENKEFTSAETRKIALGLKTTDPKGILNICKQARILYGPKTIETDMDWLACHKEEG